MNEAALISRAPC